MPKLFIKDDNGDVVKVGEFSDELEMYLDFGGCIGTRINIDDVWKDNPIVSLDQINTKSTGAANSYYGGTLYTTEER